MGQVIEMRRYRREVEQQHEDGPGALVAAIFAAAVSIGLFWIPLYHLVRWFARWLAS